MKHLAGTLHNAAIFAVALAVFALLSVIVALGGRHALDDEYDN